MYEETPIVPFNPNLALDEIDDFAEKNTKCFKYTDRDKIKTVLPLPSISRGNLLSPLNCPIIGVVKPAVVDKHISTSKYINDGDVKKKCFYDEEKTRQTTNLKYRRQFFKESDNEDIPPITPKVPENTLECDSFDKIKCDLLPWIPLPNSSCGKEGTRKIQMRRRCSEKPRIMYVFPEKSESCELLEYRLEKYRALKEQRSKKQESKLKGQRNSNQEKSKKEIEFLKPEIERVEKYIHKPNKDKDEPYVDEVVDEEKQKKVIRIRRKLVVGSYDNDTVVENELPKLLRYAWKGKLKKLSDFLKDNKNKNKINQQDSQGRTALHFAASWDCSQTLSLLLRVSNINVNLTDGHGKTPLLKAVEIYSTVCVRLLIASGANVRIRSMHGTNPFEYSLQNLGDRYISMIQNMLVEGRMFRERDRPGQMSFLHQCCLAVSKISVLEVTKELISSGSDVNHVEGTGRSPLMLAAQMDRPELVDLFITHCADVRLVDSAYKSAVHYAQQNSRCHQLISDRLKQLNPREQRQEQQLVRCAENKTISSRKQNFRQRNMKPISQNTTDMQNNNNQNKLIHSISPLE